MKDNIIDSQKEFFISRKEKIESEIQNINLLIERKIQLIEQLKEIEYEETHLISGGFGTCCHAHHLHQLQKAQGRRQHPR